MSDLFALLGSSKAKAARRALMKLTPVRNSVEEARLLVIVQISSRRTLKDPKVPLTNSVKTNMSISVRYNHKVVLNLFFVRGTKIINYFVHYSHDFAIIKFDCLISFYKSKKKSWRSVLMGKKSKKV